MRRLLIAFFAALLSGCATVATDTPRIAVMSAFQPELTLLASKVVDARTQTINGVEFTTGTLQGKPVVLFLSGMQLMILGVFGEYLGRLYLTLNRKPQAVVHRIYRKNPPTRPGEILIASEQEPKSVRA